MHSYLTILHKNKILIILIFLLLFYLFINCERRINNTTDNQLIETISADLEKYTSISSEHFWASVEPVQLELTPESAIEKIQKAVLTNKFFIFFNELDNSNTKSILVYNHAGRFYNKINANNPGPGNFSYMRDFSMRNDSLIEILDDIRKKLFFYTPDGDFQRDVTLGVSAIKFASFSDSTYLVFRGNSVNYDSLQIMSNLLIVNILKKSEVKAYVPIKAIFQDKQFNLGEYFFQTTETNKFLFCDVANDTIYECTPQRILPKYVIKFSNQDEMQKSLRKLEVEKEKKALNYSYAILEWLNNPDIIAKPEIIISRREFLLVSFRHKGKHHFMIYDKNNKSSKLFRLEENYTWQMWYGNQDEILMVLNNPIIQKNEFNQKGYPFSPEVRAIFEKINENSNPVVLRININKLFSLH